MNHDSGTNLALFIDFDNVALGVRDARQRFDIKFILQRMLEKGKIIVKRAYADWRYYKEHMGPLHEAAIELIEIPMPRISGKNSADIRLVVDAMDLCYSKEHIDTFVIMSGDSDFSPLVSKLRENDKRVIGLGVKNSSSKLLIGNCDEFIFYDDIYREAVGQARHTVTNVPADKRDLFDFLYKTTQALLQESRGVLYSSLIKDTMTRKQPDFNERSYGYANFGDLLEDARTHGLLAVERDARAGGTWVVHGVGADDMLEKVPHEKAPHEKASHEKASHEKAPQDEAAEAAVEGSGRSRSARRRRRRKREAEAVAKPEEDRTAADAGAAEARESEKPAAEAPEEQAAAEAAKKTTAKKTTKKTTKKTAKKTTTRKKAAKKSPAKKTTRKKATGKKATRKTTTKKTGRKKTTNSRKTSKKKAAKTEPEKAAAPDTPPVAPPPGER